MRILTSLAIFRFFISGVLWMPLALVATPAGATPASETSKAATQSVIAAPLPNAPAFPPIDPSRELKGVALLKALQAGGLVLYVRHAEAGKVVPDCNESSLSAHGEAQAKQLGAALRDLKIPIGQRETSEVCRVRHTADLLGLGAFRANEDLNNAPKRAGHDFHAARLRRLAVPPDGATNTLLVGHMQGGNTPDQRLFLDLGEVIVFRPDGKGASHAVARIRLTHWAELLGSR